VLDSKESEKMLIGATTEKQQDVQKKRVKARNRRCTSDENADRNRGLKTKGIPKS